jgi:peroxiredoxin
MDSHEWKFQVVLDTDGKVSKQFQVDGIPQTFIIGRGGKIERVQLGYNAGSGPDLKKTLESLIKGEEVKADGAAGDGAEQ